MCWQEKGFNRRQHKTSTLPILRNTLPEPTDAVCISPSRKRKTRAAARGTAETWAALARLSEHSEYSAPWCASEHAMLMAAAAADDAYSASGTLVASAEPVRSSSIARATGHAIDSVGAEPRAAQIQRRTQSRGRWGKAHSSIGCRHLTQSA